MMDLYATIKLKGQRASTKILKDGTNTQMSKLCLPYSKLRCLRGELTNYEIVTILTKVVSQEYSLSDMENELCRIKEMRALQNYFVKTTDCASWEEAKERYKIHNLCWYNYVLYFIFSVVCCCSKLWLKIFYNCELEIYPGNSKIFWD